MLIIDIKDDLITTELRKTDAQILAVQTGISATFWGITILIISIVILYFLLRLNFKESK